jgi:hypothetical protein
MTYDFAEECHYCCRPLTDGVLAQRFCGHHCYETWQAQTGVMLVGEFTQARLDELIAGEWTLEQYIRWGQRYDEAKRQAGWWVGSHDPSPEYWAEYGIHTAAQYAAMIDAEYEREERKSRY